ncbi:MAG TPA: stalk domain-containing protein, partial [Bacilli bacterium]
PIEEKGIIINSKTMLPLSNVARTLQALVKWDSATETAFIYKPNVHITLFEMIKDKISGPFGNVEYKGKYDFVIFTQVDSLLTEVSSIKVTMEDPYGKEVVSENKELTKDQKNNFWFGTPTITHLFKYTGKYTVKFYMKAGDGPYSLVSEKVIQSYSQK